MAIRYLSFDFDGCLFNNNYAQEPDSDHIKYLGDAVLIHNRAFLDQIKIENAAYDEVYVMIGSNRQSYRDDQFNMGPPARFKGSCFPAIQKVCADLDVPFDPFLIADVTGDLPYGRSYELSMQEIASGNYLGEEPILVHAEFNMDESKRTLLFAQMQKAAADHPDEEIVFDFFDDKDDILQRHLKEFFTKYPHMMPKNVTLRLNKYTGSDVTLVATIKGTGEPYPDYCDHIMNMLDHLWEHDEIAQALIPTTQIDNGLEGSNDITTLATNMEPVIQIGEDIVTETIDTLDAVSEFVEIEHTEVPTEAIGESEHPGEKELASSNESTLGYLTDNSSGEPRAKLVFAKKNHSQNDINRWFVGYQQPEYMEDGDQIVLFINVHPESPFKDPTLFQAIEILRQQHIVLSDKAIETLQQEFNSVKPVLAEAQAIAMATDADFKIYLDAYTNAFSDMPEDYPTKYRNQNLIEDDGREKEEESVATDDSTDLSAELSDEDTDIEYEDSDLEYFEDNDVAEEAKASTAPAAMPAPAQPLSKTESPATIEVSNKSNQQTNPAGNPGRNQFAFHKPVPPVKINRAPMRLPEDKVCSASGSCLIS